MAAAGAAGLEAFLFAPSTTGKHPLVIMTHGTNYSKGTNQEIGPGLLQPEALWFVRRGWDVVVVVRRGYGNSGGQIDRRFFGCTEENFESIAEQDAADLQAAYDALALFPDVDITRVIATGASTGGFAAISFGAKAPPGLKAVINFSGGWHKQLFAGSCAKSGIIPAFQKLGSVARVPMLWLYADNDSFFGPQYVSQAHEAFTSAGGNADLFTFKKSGEDGHYLFSESPQLWGPVVQQYLRQLGLPADPLYPDTPPSVLRLPAGFSDEAQKAFSRFQTLGPYRAFAIGPNGAWGYSSGKRTPKAAIDDALGRCINSACVVIAKDPE